MKPTRPLPLRERPDWPGWARCVGLFRPKIEIGMRGMCLVQPWWGALLCHEYVHLVGRHNLRLALASTGAGLAAFLGVVLAGLSFEETAIAAPLAACLAAVPTALWIRRLHEREADAHAAHQMGLIYHRLVRDLLAPDSSWWGSLVYGKDRVERVLAIAKASKNGGYPDYPK